MQQKSSGWELCSRQSAPSRSVSSGWYAWPTKIWRCTLKYAWWAFTKSCDQTHGACSGPTAANGHGQAIYPIYQRLIHRHSSKKQLKRVKRPSLLRLSLERNVLNKLEDGVCRFTTSPKPVVRVSRGVSWRRLVTTLRFRKKSFKRVQKAIRLSFL